MSNEISRFTCKQTATHNDIGNTYCFVAPVFENVYMTVDNRPQKMDNSKIVD